MVGNWGQARIKLIGARLELLQSDGSKLKLGPGSNYCRRMVAFHAPRREAGAANSSLAPINQLEPGPDYSNALYLASERFGTCSASRRKGSPSSFVHISSITVVLPSACAFTESRNAGPTSASL